METIIEIMLIVIIVIATYFLKKYSDWQALRPIIAEVVRIILKVEKENKTLNGEAKKEIVESEINKNLEQQDIKKIKKSPFKKIGRFVQYVFVTFAEPIIIAKFGKK